MRIGKKLSSHSKQGNSNLWLYFQKGYQQIDKAKFKLYWVNERQNDLQLTEITERIILDRQQFKINYVKKKVSKKRKDDQERKKAHRGANESLFAKG